MLREPVLVTIFFLEQSSTLRDSRQTRPNKKRPLSAYLLTAIALVYTLEEGDKGYSLSVYKRIVGE
jgi:hypothetical protein